MIYISILLFSLFSVNDEPDWGKYYIVGKAFNSDSLLIKNEQLSFVNLYNEITKFKTNESGEFKMEVYWLGYDYDMGFTDRNGNKIDYKKEGDLRNPPIKVFRDSDAIQIPNFWFDDSKLPFSEFLIKKS